MLKGIMDMIVWLKNRRQRALATIPLAGIDASCHSCYLWSGVIPFWALDPLLFEGVYILIWSHHCSLSTRPMVLLYWSAFKMQDLSFKKFKFNMAWLRLALLQCSQAWLSTSHMKTSPNIKLWPLILVTEPVRSSYTTHSPTMSSSTTRLSRSRALRLRLHHFSPWEEHKVGSPQCSLWAAWPSFLCHFGCP